MGAGHGHALHYHGHSIIHRAPAHWKLLALLGFMFTVVATPKEWPAVFGVYLGLLLVVIAVSRVPPSYLLKRMLVEIPFLAFAVVVPFVATGPRVEVAGVSVSQAGLLVAWGLAVKGALGVLASLTLAATTEPPDILAGLSRLRFPSQLVEIMGFMVRYLGVIAEEMRHMRMGLESRGFVGRDPRHWPVIARSAGALFVRSYERGERVHVAMLSRGHGEGQS